MANKSKNVSFRYDIERFAFVKTKEKLEKDQQVLDFLVNKYWWEHKIATPTYKDIPPADFKPLPVFQKSDTKDTPAVKRSFAQFLLAKQNCESPEEFEALRVDLANADHITASQKKQIIP